MGVLTDFFAATPEQLLAAFPDWSPVDPSPKMGEEREVPNPFKPGEMMIVKAQPKWEPLPRPPGITPTDGYQHLPHICFKNLDHIGLSVLSEQLSVLIYDDCMAQISEPALLPQGGESEAMLNQLPPPLTLALAELPEHPVEAGTRWEQSEDIRFSVEECVEVLQGLSTVAKAANEVSGEMFIYLSW